MAATDLIEHATRILRRVPRQAKLWNDDRERVEDALIGGQAQRCRSVVRVRRAAQREACVRITSSNRDDAAAFGQHVPASQDIVRTIEQLAERLRPAEADT